MKKIIIVLIFMTALPFLSRTVSAQSNVLINEFVIEQSPQAVELINTGAEPVDISGWYIDDNGGTSFYTISANTLIYPNSCMVFASEFNLNRSSADTVRLFDATAAPTAGGAQLIDSYPYTTVPGGVLSFSRIPDGEAWGTATSSIGKFNTSGLSCIFVPSPTITPAATVTPSPTIPVSADASPTPTQAAIQNIFISEVMPNPETGEKEWVELYNDNEFEVNLVNWYLDDEESAGAAPKQFSVKIPARSYASYDLPTGIYNNDADSVRLLNENKIVVDSMQYSVTVKNQSIGRIEFVTDTFCQQVSSKNASNLPCSLLETSTSTSIATSSAGQIIRTTPTPMQYSPPSILSSTESTYNPKILISPSPLYKTISFNKVQKNQATDDENYHSETISQDEDQVALSQPDPGNTVISPLIKSLSLSSGSFSILSIVSLLLKQKLKFEQI